MYAVGVNPWVWTSPVDDEALAELIPRIASFGFDAVELPIEQPGDWDPVRTRDLLAAYGLVAAGVCAVTPPGRDLVDAAPAVVESTVAYLMGCVASAAAVGAPCVGGPVYAAVGRTWRMSATARAACYADFRRALAPVAEQAGECGVSIGVEALNRYETSVVNTIEQTIELIDGLPPNVGIMIDTYHMNIEEADPYEALAVAGRHIKHVQVSGTDRGAPGGTTSTGPDSSTPCEPPVIRVRSASSRSRRRTRPSPPPRRSGVRWPYRRTVSPWTACTTCGRP